MKDYKSTLLMPKTSFDMKANLNQKEPSIQQQWQDNKIYQKLASRDAPIFVLHDGPPYANGNIHVGHALNKILKDFILRFQAMHGYKINYIPGWDTHGLPIENAISKSNQDYNKNLDPITKRKLCHDYALQQIDNQLKQFCKLGLVSDFATKYLTMDKQFEVDELTLFKKMIENKLVYQDFKPVYWSWSSQTALADAEIEYAEERSPSIYVKFDLTQKLNNVDTSIIIWTTTPWTIPSNLAVAINSQIEYSQVKVADNYYLIGSKLVAKIAETLSWNDYKVIQTYTGEQLAKLNLKYTHPLNLKTNPIILASYVSDIDGTGLVHNAPGFGLDDYYACKKYNIDVYCPINDTGHFDNTIYDKDLVGVFYQDASKIIGQKLEQSGHLLKLNFIKHQVAHDWRTKKPVMYRATKQWFINIACKHADIIATLDKDVITANSKIKDRMKDMILNRNEWCISRQRVWGVPIPIIFDHNKQPILDLELIQNIIDIIAVNGSDIWFEKDATFFLTPKFDKTLKYYKETDILDVWFDSGSSFNILKNHGLEYPADVYLEGSDQFRGWFNSSLINGVIMYNKAPYKKLLQHGFVLDEKSRKMSKSVGNVIDPLKICNQYGADILRLWVASCDYSIDVKIGDNIIKQTAETYRRIRNTLFRYTLSNLHDFNYQTDFQKKLRIEDQYILVRLQNISEKINQAYLNNKFLDVVKIANNFTIELSSWYFDIIKDVIYCEKQKDIKRLQIQTTLYILLETMLLWLTPIIPHTCEEAYSQFTSWNYKKESICLESFSGGFSKHKVEISLSNQQLTDFENFFKLKNIVYVELENARNNNLIKKNNEAKVIINENYNFNSEQLKSWLNVACVVVDNTISKVIVNTDNLNKCLRCWNYFDQAKMHDSEICIRCAKVIG